MESLFIRFPDGTREFRMTERALGVGDRLRNGGHTWRVISVTSDVTGRTIVVVEPESPTVGETLRSEEGALVLEEIVGSEIRQGKEPVADLRTVPSRWPEPYEFDPV
jgi:hypothetical protein